MHYRTRVMVAQADFLHGADLLHKGDTFVATQIDADYLFRRGRAIYAPEPAPAAKAEAPVPAPVAAPAVEEPVVAPAPSVEADAPVHQEAAAAEPAAESQADEPAADVKTEAAPAPVEPARRGGRRVVQPSTPASE